MRSLRERFRLSNGKTARRMTRRPRGGYHGAILLLFRNMPPEQPQNSPDGSGEVEHDPLTAWLGLMKESEISTDIIKELREQLAIEIAAHRAVQARMERCEQGSPDEGDDILQLIDELNAIRRRRDTAAGILREELKRVGGMEAELRTLDQIMQYRDSG